MSEIKIASFGFGKRYSLLSEGIRQAYDGDTIKIKKPFVALTQRSLIDKRLYIEGEGMDRTTVSVSPHMVGLLMAPNASLTLSHLTIVVENQCNGIGEKAYFAGSLTLDHVRMVHRSGIAVREIYPSIYLSDKFDASDSKSKSRGTIKIMDSELDRVSLSAAHLSIVRSKIGNVIATDSFLSSPDLRLSAAVLSGLTLCNRNQKTTGINQLSSYGRLTLKGSFDIQTFRALALPNLDGFFARRTFKQQLSSFKRAPRWFFINACPYFSDAAVRFHRLDAESPLISMPAEGEKRLYQTAFLNNQGTTVIFSDLVIPKFPLKNETHGGSLRMESVQDASGWICEETSLAQRGDVTSELFAQNAEHADASGSGESLRALDQLDQLTGLQSVKTKIHQMVATATLNAERKRRGLPVAQGFSLHMIFAGNAGTGKTTVARLFGRALYENGVLAEDKFVEASRKDLVAGYVGQTAPKTHQVIMQARGGVLFIDEAYTLISQGANDFANEAVSQLIADMENYRDDLVVILAGYTEDMQRLIREGNQGLKSRFANWIEFEDYTIDELIDILNAQLEAQQLIVPDDETGYQLADSLELLSGLESGRGSGNGRFVRNYVQALIMAKDVRLSKSNLSELDNDALMTISQEDVAAAQEHLLAQTEAMGQ